MRRFVPGIATAVAFLVGGATTAQAADTVAIVASALKSSPVYVASNVPGVPPDTAGALEQQLNDGDNIVLVILPASALGQTGGDGRAFARQLDDATSHKRIIGLVAGDQYAGYSSLLPEGVAADLMNRATAVSDGASERLRTFVRNVHDWQQLHPSAPASKPQAKSQGGPPILLIVVGVAGFGIIAFFVIILMMGGGEPDVEDRVKFSASPDPVRDKLKRIQDLRAKISDPTLQSAIVDLCRHCEMYFKRNEGRTTFDSDVSTFEQHLDSIVQVLEQYIDIQDNRIYYDKADARLQEGFAAVRDFADSVLESIRRGNSMSLLDFEVNTKILSAQRRRYL